MLAQSRSTRRSQPSIYESGGQEFESLRARHHHLSELTNQDKIFEPMFTTKAAGMGMGLWICRAIVEFYGGELTAWSRVDDGSTFQISLPKHS